MILLQGFFITEVNRNEAHLEEVGRILPFVFGNHLQRQGSRLVGILTALWPRAVGKLIAEHSRPVTFVSGTLTLASACPSWAAQLGQMSEELRAGINSFLGRPVVRKLRVRHAPSLILENGASKVEARNWKLETGISKLAGPDWKPAVESTGLDPENVRFVEEAFAKYFSRAPNRQREPEQGPTRLSSPRRARL